MSPSHALALSVLYVTAFPLSAQHEGSLAEMSLLVQGQVTAGKGRSHSPWPDPSGGCCGVQSMHVYP